MVLLFSVLLGLCKGLVERLVPANERVQNFVSCCCCCGDFSFSTVPYFSLGRRHRVSFPGGKRLLELIYETYFKILGKDSFFMKK